MWSKFLIIKRQEEEVLDRHRNFISLILWEVRINTLLERVKELSSPLACFCLDNFDVITFKLDILLKFDIL